MEFDKINNAIKSKTRDAKNALIAEQAKLGMKHGKNKAEPEPLTNINNRFSQDAGIITRIRFKFKRSGVFVHKGVGRGTTIGQVGSTGRKAKPWFNPIIEKYADDLMENVADEWINVSFDKLKIK